MPFSSQLLETAVQYCSDLSRALRTADPLVAWAVVKEDLALNAVVGVSRVLFDREPLDEGHLACEVSSQFLLLDVYKL